MEPTTSQDKDFEATTRLMPALGASIVSSPDSCGGKPRIAGTRIQVKLIVVMHEHQGMTIEQIVSEYPHLSAPEVEAALAYYRDHSEEVNADIRAEREWYESMRSHHPSLLKEKLQPRNRDAPDDSFSP